MTATIWIIWKPAFLMKLTGLKMFLSFYILCLDIIFNSYFWYNFFQSTEAVFVEEHLGFVQAFLKTLSVIFVSEIGDKTFFIAAIMAMKHPRLMVFLGAMSALAFMTVISGKFINICEQMHSHWNVE